VWCSGLHDVWRAAGIKPCLLLVLTLAAALLSAPKADAATSSCSFSSASLIFSPYDTVTKAAVDGLGTISFTCIGSGTDTLNIVLGRGNAGTCNPRAMANGTAKLSYQIYKESARVNVWCDNRVDIPVSYATGATQTVTVTMYGRVLSGQTPTYGAYSDAVTATLKKGGGVFATGTVSVQGSVDPTCSVSAGTLSFGTYTPTAAADSTATISVNCTNTAPYQVSLAGGQNLNGGVRRLAGPGGSYLNYGLFSDPGRVTPWGDGTAIGAKVSGTGSGNTQSLTVYGRIPANQSPRPGSYSDSVFVTVDY
jgi:spore coat protein U-like protein